MAAYIGAPEDHLIQSLGVPDKQISVNGVQYLAYVRQQTQIQPGAGFGYGGWGGPYWGPYYGGGFAFAGPQNVQVWSCETTFAVKEGHVADVTFKGNDCS